ncbi:MAG: uroporphyrinogen-III C-methyltransferase [Cytophagaceae bacterium]|nr:uroporphyrinogen-III C-methyltransferase [Cytophagaceae bacterium]MDW8455994.1 uroporphyrinogen-III C-methyltransferase [Cytophagaceae bacterium]
MNSPKLTLVGAGPGDPDLISVKGVKALADADVVLYDALINTELLNYAPSRALKIFVGKKKGFCQFKQSDINKMIVDYALQYGHVVRLKGGDPFIFGRGHEEMLYAQSFNIPVEVVPGISSSYSVPEMQGIPLTRRAVNESFWVITGSTQDHKLSEDVALAAQSTATIVILMGMTRLPEIVEIFKQHGKTETPVAVIQNGTLPNEKIALGNISTIVENVRKNNMDSPAVIVIGEVVREHRDFTSEVLKSIKEKKFQ